MFRESRVFVLFVASTGSHARTVFGLKLLLSRADIPRKVGFMSTIVGIAALAVSAAVPLGTARLVLGLVLQFVKARGQN
jgi:hypothetical protein